MAQRFGKHNADTPFDWGERGYQRARERTIGTKAKSGGQREATQSQPVLSIISTEALCSFIRAPFGCVFVSGYLFVVVLNGSQHEHRSHVGVRSQFVDELGFCSKTKGRGKLLIIAFSSLLRRPHHDEFGPTCCFAW